MKSSILGLGLCLLSLVGISGCSSATAGSVEELVPVSGQVLLGGEPVEGLSLTFMPSGNNSKSHPGTGITDSDGNFEILNYRNKRGLPPGSYTILGTLWLMPDGTLPPLDTPPITSGATERVPQIWANPTKAGRHNKVIVPEDGKTDFVIKIPKA